MPDLPFYPCSVDCSFKIGNYFISLIRYCHLIHADLTGKGYFPSCYYELISRFHLFEVGNTRFYAHALYTVTISGKSQGRVSKGIRYSAVGYAKTIGHFRTNGHPKTTTSRLHFHDLYSKPLAEGIVTIHMINDLVHFNYSIFNFH